MWFSTGIFEYGTPRTKNTPLAGGRGIGTFVENAFTGGVHVCSLKDQVGFLLYCNNTLEDKYLRNYVEHGFENK